MTTVRALSIGFGGADATLACGHTQHITAWSKLPRPGEEYECAICRKDSAAWDDPIHWPEFTAVELQRLRWWRWARLEGWGFAMEEVAR